MGLPDGLVRGGKACAVGTVPQTLFLCLKSTTQAAAEHKTTPTKAESAIIAITPPLSPLLCRTFCTSTPRGLFVLALLVPEYGPPSIMVMPEGKGGDGGKPTITGAVIYINSQLKIITQRERGKNLSVTIYQGSGHIVLHSPQSWKIL